MLQLAVGSDRSIGVNQDKHRLSDEHWIPSEQFEMVERGWRYLSMSSLSLSLSLFSLSLSPSIFLSCCLPRKHTCCANFKSGYTGAIIISRAWYFTTVGMQRVLSICALDVFIRRYVSYNCSRTIQQYSSSSFFYSLLALGIEQTWKTSKYLSFIFYWNTLLNAILFFKAAYNIRIYDAKNQRDNCLSIKTKPVFR